MNLNLKTAVALSSSAATLYLEKLMNTQPQMDSTDEQWFLELDGQRRGPLSQAQVLQLIADETATPQTRAWRKGYAHWRPLAETELAPATHTMPPPIAPSKVSSGLAWTLAFAPLLGEFCAGFLAGATRTSIDEYWWVTLVLNVVLSLLDERRLGKAGYQTPGAGAALLVPFYLFKRAQVLQQSQTLLVIWLLLFVLTLLS